MQPLLDNHRGMTAYGLEKGFKAVMPFIRSLHAGVGKGYWNMEVLIVEIYEP